MSAAGEGEYGVHLRLATPSFVPGQSLAQTPSRQPRGLPARQMDELLGRSGHLIHVSLRNRITEPNPVGRPSRPNRSAAPRGSMSGQAWSPGQARGGDDVLMAAPNPVPESWLSRISPCNGSAPGAAIYGTSIGPLDF